MGGHHRRGERATLEPLSPPQGNMLRGRTGKRPVCGINLKSQKQSSFGTSDRENETCTRRRERATGRSKSKCPSTCFLGSEKLERLRDDEGILYPRFSVLSSSLHRVFILLVCTLALYFAFCFFVSPAFTRAHVQLSRFPARILAG